MRNAPSRKGKKSHGAWNWPSGAGQEEKQDSLGPGKQGGGESQKLINIRGERKEREQMGNWEKSVGHGRL